MACGTCTSCEDGPCKGLLPETELPTNLPVVVYDGNCSFCRRWLKRYEAVCPPERLAWCSADKAAGHYPGITEDQFGKWQRYTTKTNEADAFRVMKNKAKSDGRRYKLTDESGNLLDLIG